MPKPIKKRITKKPDTRESEVKGILMGGLDFLKEKKKPALITASVIGAFLVLYIIVSFYRASVTEEALTLESKAYEYYFGTNISSSLPEEDRWKNALDLFKKSVETKETPTALFYLGNCYYKLGDYESAIREYTAFTDRFGDAAEILPIVYQKLASAYFKAGRKEEALNTLETLSGITGRSFRDTALVLEARYYQSTGNSEQELKLYREIVSQFPDSPWLAEAQARIGAEEAAGTVDAEETAVTEEMNEDAGVIDEEVPREPAGE
jgi:tetratricopeptide (TPR) repeat protein